MGGRGAKAGNVATKGNTAVTKAEREAYQKYVQERLNNKEYIRANQPGRFAIEYPEEYVRDYQRNIKEQTEKVKVARQLAKELGFSEANYRQFLTPSYDMGYSREQGTEYSLAELKRQLKVAKSRNKK